MIVAVEMANQRILPRSDGLIWLAPADNEESCPAGETWSDCDAGCETTCENVGKPVVCPRMCVPGCVCEEPGTVRGPDKKCIHPPLCPSADEPPVTPYDVPVTLNGEWEPNLRYENKKCQYFFA
ncbi:hypothetical protein AVEN_39011-1 [Araneus ventricosus]|uniref:TIL domain-containing protein n=1 Tax=Araneus ventricosus TaxID=182803 RepID=A0A4Y2DQE3_ARAVE|nr:hypothetical protein AVEN_39011-1 [Araneus ventricosus]